MYQMYQNDNIKSNPKKLFKEFVTCQKNWSKYVDEGKATKEEAIIAIFTKAMQVLDSLKMPVTDYDDINVNMSDMSAGR